MPSPRRVKLVALSFVVLVVMCIIYTFGQSHSQDFHSRTVNGLGKSRASGQQEAGADRDDAELAKQMAERLKQAEAQAKAKANEKAPKPDSPRQVVGVGSSAGGQKKGKDEKVEEETEEEHEIETTLNDILKKSPVIIFSKTYCPHSKRAKGLLLEKYTIDPAPFVVELDKHPLGLQMQARLGTMTGRTTVPNIMINGKSIGGADDIVELDNNHALVDKIKTLGGKRVDMKERFVGFADDKPAQKAT